MRLLSRPGPLLAALALPFLGFADTGGSATAVLYIAGSTVVGEAGAYEGYCRPVLGPLPPAVSLSQMVSLFHDADGDGLLDPGDMVAYTAEVRNLFPEESGELKALFLLPPALEPVSLPAEANVSDIGPFRAVVSKIPSLPPNGVSRIGFASRLTETVEMPSLFVQGLVIGDGFTVMADVPSTSAVLDPVAIAMQEPAGAASALFPGPGRFIKRVRGGPIVVPGEILEFTVEFEALDATEKVIFVDFLPPPLELESGSLTPGNATVLRRSDLVFVIAEFRGVSPGERLVLKYRATVAGVPKAPYLATHALAFSARGEALFSDDPRTREPSDPTAILFPWMYQGKTWEVWEKVLKSGLFFVPVVVRNKYGEELRWAKCGEEARERAEAGGLIFAGLARVPLKRLPEGLSFGLAGLPKGGAIYIPVDYGLPVFAELEEHVEEVRGLPLPACEEIFLPVLVEIPPGQPSELTGVITDEGL